MRVSYIIVVFTIGLLAGSEGRPGIRREDVMGMRRVENRQLTVSDITGLSTRSFLPSDSLIISSIDVIHHFRRLSDVLFHNDVNLLSLHHPPIYRV